MAAYIRIFGRHSAQDFEATNFFRRFNAYIYCDIVCFYGKITVSPKNFFVTYFILLVLNIIWLCCTMYLNSNQRPTNIVKQERYDAPKIWIINNFIHSFLMLPFLNIVPSLSILTTNQSVQHITLLILCVTNSIFDFMLTSSYYFPRLDASHDQRLRGED